MIKLLNYFKDLSKIKYFEGWGVVDLVWLIISTVTISIAVWIGWDPNPSALHIGIISAAGTLTGMWCVIAVNKQRISNYIFGFINVVLFGIMYFQIGLFGMALLNILYFVPMQFHGIYKWLQKRVSIDVTSVRWSTKKELAMYLTLTVVGVAAMYFLLIAFQDFMGNLGFLNLSYYGDGNIFYALILLDAVGVIGNIIAQVLMNLTLNDQWIYWLVIDITQVIALGLILSKVGSSDSYALSMFVMYICWTINAGFGLYNWNRSIKKLKE